MSHKVFASKSKFADSKIFKSESATKYGRGILSQARDKLDVKKNWSKVGEMSQTFVHLYFFFVANFVILYAFCLAS